ncbi:MAG: hypothetical protein IJ622_00645 [Bacteroidales bacterium]|nr:hypothetical protein [Bacteroidales bacterium]
MPNERKYIYLEKIMKKVPIHAVNGAYTWEIGDTSSGISEEVERLLVYALYVGHPDYNFFELARLNLPKKVFGDSSPEVIRSSFKGDHPLSDITEYDYDMVETFADPVQGMCIYSDKKQSLWITRDDERVLLSMLNDDTPWDNCKSYLRTIPERYAMKLDEVSIIQALARFCILHGVEANPLREKDRTFIKLHQNDSNEIFSSTKENEGHVSYAFVFGIILAIIIIGLWTAVFSRQDIPTILIPIITMGFIFTEDLYIKNDTTKNAGIPMFYIGFLVLNFIASIIAFCIEGSGKMALIAVLNIIAPSLYHRLRGGTFGE